MCRAEARSSTSRTSPSPYFCAPARSAWPGRGFALALVAVVFLFGSIGRTSVLIVLDGPGSALTAQGQAMDSGAIGERIHVLNLLHASLKRLLGLVSTETLNFLVRTFEIS